MAGSQAANTFDTHDAVGNREELSDIIEMITPEKTPFRSMLEKSDVKTTHPEWQTDALADPDPDNAYVQGAEYTYDPITATVRVGNYTQISRKTMKVARTQDKTDKAGRKTETARELRKKGVELKRDQEIILLRNQASTPGNSGVAARSGGFAAWLATNASRGSGGSDGGFNASTRVVDAATDGTQRAFSKTLLDDTIEMVANAGGEPTVLMGSNYIKRKFSTFMSDASVAAFRTNLSGKKQGTIYGAADLYVSDFGELSVVPNVQMTLAGATVARNAFLITPGMVSLGVFDDIHQDKPAKTGDAEPRVLLTEYTLKVNNEAAHGIIADLYGISASA
jgi:hypothetical protein